jgi:hypothetical protein
MSGIKFVSPLPATLENLEDSTKRVGKVDHHMLQDVG